MVLLLTDLPTELLQKVLIYAATDTKTLLNCEKTCHRLCNVVKQDKIWGFVPVLRSLADTLPRFDTLEPLPLSFFSSRREYACVTNAIRVSWREQQHSENIIIDILGAEGWREMIQDDDTLCRQSRDNVLGILEQYDDIDLDSHRFIVRRDTLHTLVELVQEAMLCILREAHSLACAIANATDTYPKLTIPAWNHGRDSVLKNALELEPTFPMASRLAVAEPFRHRIIHRLALRAGIIRVDNDVLELAWVTLVHVTRLLLRPACMELIGASDCSSDQGYQHFLLKPRRFVQSHESIRNIPPASTIGVCTSCSTASYIHILVPRQIETAAQSLGLPSSHVYGDYWLVQGACVNSEFYWEASRDALIEEAELQYEFQDDDGEEEEEFDLDLQYYEQESGCLCASAPQVVRMNDDEQNGGDEDEEEQSTGGSNILGESDEESEDADMSENEENDDLDYDFLDDFVCMDVAEYEL